MKTTGPSGVRDMSGASGGLSGGLGLSGRSLGRVWRALARHKARNAPVRALAAFPRLAVNLWKLTCQRPYGSRGSAEVIPRLRSCLKECL